jgi:anaerobic ribonucleoside-triphosphate reductase activating protein
MQELTFILDELGGDIIVEDNEHLSAETLRTLQNHLGEAQEIACARPLEILLPPATSFKDFAEKQYVRIAGFYHNSLTEGPGRRSSVLFQFCPLKCKGCYVPELHSKNSGVLIESAKLAELLLDPGFERDGVTILGGEPFAQGSGLLALLKELRSKNCPHIVCYSGYTLEALREMAVGNTLIAACLNEIDVLIDGPFVQSLAGKAGLWTGSGNQRVIDLAATRARNSGRIVLYQD